MYAPRAAVVDPSTSLTSAKSRLNTSSLRSALNRRLDDVDPRRTRVPCNQSRSDVYASSATTGSPAMKKTKEETKKSSRVTLTLLTLQSQLA
jgi:hypothetical protein